VKSDQPFPDRAKTRRAEKDQIRETMARILRLVFLVCSVVLALGAFLVAARDNVSSDNALVKFVLDFADAIDGPFSRRGGIFEFHGQNAATKDAVVNWGIAAIVYLAIGRYLQRLLAPRSTV
jgi:ABC-type glucose/galactose transport system permease subunit